MKNQRQRLSFMALLLGLSLLAVWIPGPARSVSTSVLITAVYYDTYLTNEPGEAVRLMNLGGTAVASPSRP